MPTFFPKGRTNRKFAEKMTFRGAGVEGLIEIIDTFVPEQIDKSVDISAPGRDILDFVTSDDFNEIRTPLYEYLPDYHLNSKFPEKLTLRGPEVDALREILSKLNGAELSTEAEFLRDFVENQIGNEKLHVRMPNGSSENHSEDDDE